MCPAPTTPTTPRGRGPVLVASHERSGTHLLIDILRRNFAAFRARPQWGHNPHDWLYFNLDRLDGAHDKPVDTGFADRAMSRASRPLLKSHALPGFVGVRPAARGWLESVLARTSTLYVLRDGRAVMPSFHRHWMSMEPSTTRDFATFLRTPIDGRTPPMIWAEHVNAWSTQPGVEVVRFEDMTGDPEAVLKRLAVLLGETPDPSVSSVLPPRGASPWLARFARLTGRLESSNLVEIGERTPRWKDLFTPDDRAFFEEQAGETLAAFGYLDAERNSQTTNEGSAA